MVKITCLTENTALRGSSFWAEHGLSFLIITVFVFGKIDLAKKRQ
jgi:metal-dependent hydrolase (beta-lactamase superfamily II)